MDIFRGVKLLGHPPYPLEDPTFFRSTSEKFGFDILFLGDSKRRSSSSFLFLLGSSSRASKASSAFMNFCASYINSNMDLEGSLQSWKRKSPFWSPALNAVRATNSLGSSIWTALLLKRYT